MLSDARPVTRRGLGHPVKILTPLSDSGNFACFFILLPTLHCKKCTRVNGVNIFSRIGIHVYASVQTSFLL